MRKRSRNAWGLLFGVLLLMLVARVYYAQRPNFRSTQAVINADNVSDVQRIGTIEVSNPARFDASGQWILEIGTQYLRGINVAQRRPTLLLQNEQLCLPFLPNTRTCTNQYFNFTYNYYQLDYQFRTTPDGRYMATYWTHGDHEGLSVWDMASRERVYYRSFFAQSSLNLMTFTPDSESLIFNIPNSGIWRYTMATDGVEQIDTDDPVRLLSIEQSIMYQTTDWIKRVTDDGATQLYDVSNLLGRTPYISPDARYIVSQETRPSHTLIVYDREMQREYTMSSHINAIYAIDFSPDNSLMATSDYSGVLMVWNIEPGTIRHSLGNRDIYGGASSVAFSSDGSLLFASSFRGLNIYDTHTGTMRKTFDETDSNFDIYLSPDGRYLMTESGRMYGVR